MTRAPWFGMALAVMRLDAGRFQVVCVDTDDATALVDCLTWLIEKSLVLVEDGPNGERWYRQLETIRQFGARQLRTFGHERAILERHCQHFVQLSDQADHNIRWTSP